MISDAFQVFKYLGEIVETKEKPSTNFKRTIKGNVDVSHTCSYLGLSVPLLFLLLDIQKLRAGFTMFPLASADETPYSSFAVGFLSFADNSFLTSRLPWNISEEIRNLLGNETGGNCTKIRSEISGDTSLKKKCYD